MKCFLFSLVTLISVSFYSQTSLCFSEPYFRAVGPGLQSLTSADLNNDGFPDIITTDRGIDSISVLINSGNGILFSRSDYLVGNLPEKVIAVDFNGDGNKDLAVATNTMLNASIVSLVYVLIGSPTGTFSAATNYTVSGGSNTLVSGDFNVDGKFDLAVGGYVNISFLNGNGNGAFSQAYTMPTLSDMTPYDMVTHDFDSDGKTDLAFIDVITTDQMYVYRYGHALSQPISFGIGNCMSLTSGDYNKDGNLDIAACGMDMTSVLFGLGGGQFSSAVTYTLQGAQESHGILSLDMNNDSNLDLVICEAQDRLYVLYGSANGLFNVSPVIYFTGTGTMPWAITAADFNIDGKIDFATANPNLNSISVLLNGVQPNITISPLNSNICIGSAVSLQAIGANAYSWNTGETTSLNHQTPITNTNYTVTGTSINYCSNSQTVNVAVDPTCADVWPGDANSDGTADNLDVLELGLHYTQTGPARATISNSWQSYFSNNWSGTITNGKNLNHSDCNGDGTINDNDTLAIYTNYGLTHAFKGNSQTVTNPQLIIVPDQAAVVKGTWGTASVYLGDAANPINNINGVAFTVNFDNTLIETNSVWIEYPNSFIEASNLHFIKLDFGNNNLFTATTHTVSNNVSGNGLIAVLHYQIKSSLTTDQVLNLGIVQANQSDASGTIVSLTSGTATLMAMGSSVGINELSIGNLISAVPNPASSVVLISSTSDLERVEIVNLTGQVLISEVTGEKTHRLNVEGLANGVYFIKAYTGSKQVVLKKLVIQK
jgi:hypothetical protein